MTINVIFSIFHNFNLKNQKSPVNYSNKDSNNKGNINLNVFDRLNANVINNAR